MGNHGAVCYGADVYQGFHRMETVEHFARIAFVAEMLGGAKVLPKTEVDKLFDSRTRYGVKARAGAEPGCPLVAEDCRSRRDDSSHARRTDRACGRSSARAGSDRLEGSSGGELRPQEE